MIANYMKTAYRGLEKSKLVSSINIIGLAAGLTFAILAGRYVYTEKNFDTFHENHRSIYRVEKSIPGYGISCYNSNIMQDWLKSNIPEIKKTVRIINDAGIIGNRPNILYKNAAFNIEQPLIVDSDFFTMFSFKISRGELQSFGSDIQTVALKESLAKKMFGDINPIGKLIEYKNKTFTVKAIIAEPPSNSSIKFDILLPIENKPGYVTDDWGNNTLQIFVQTAANVSHTELENKITTETNSLFKSLGYSWYNEASSNKFILNPLRNIYYSDTPMDDVCIHGNSKTTLLLAGLALVVLLIAMINFVNIIYVKTMSRIKELGIRSASGASLLDNIRLLVYDSIIPGVLSFLLAMGFVYGIEPFVNPLLNTPLARLSGLQLLVIFAGVFTLSIIAGIYPAFKTASMNAVESLKGKKRTAGRRSAFKGSLSVVQFTASIVLIISLFVIYRQIRYVIRESSSNLGKDIVVYLHISNRAQETSSKIFTIQNALRSLAEVKTVSTSQSIPGDKSYSDLGVKFKKEGEDERMIMVNHNMVDAGYPEVIGCEIVEGRSFNNMIQSDRGCCIVNESFIKKYDLHNISDAVIDGKPIIGVVKDFHYNSLRSKIEPLAIQYANLYQSQIVVRLAGADGISFMHIVEKIRNTVDKIDRTAISDVNFLDEHIAALYDNEVRISRIMFWLSLFSIIISCMGLFASSLFMVEARIKEIGIRKVVGASNADVLMMVTKDFTKWIIAANIIAYPVAYFAMARWLENFAYRTGLSWWIFLLSGGIALLIGLLTVSWQAIRAATANPVEALKYE